MAKKRDQRELEAFINSHLLPNEQIEHTVIASVDMPLFYVLTNLRLIGTHLYESGNGVNVESIPYREISAVSVDDDGPNDKIMSEVVVRDLNVFGSFGRLWMRIRDDAAGGEFYRRLLSKVLT